MSDEVFCGELDKNTKKPESSFLELSDFFQWTHIEPVGTGADS